MAYKIQMNVVKFDENGEATITQKGQYNILMNSFGITDFKQSAFENNLGFITLEELSKSDTRISGQLKITGDPNKEESYLVVLWE